VHCRGMRETFERQVGAEPDMTDRRITCVQILYRKLD
jgi:hypothetical protein